MDSFFGKVLMALFLIALLIGCAGRMIYAAVKMIITGEPALA